jgi:hypothetical protein
MLSSSESYDFRTVQFYTALRNETGYGGGDQTPGGGWPNERPATNCLGRFQFS